MPSGKTTIKQFKADYLKWLFTIRINNPSGKCWSETDKTWTKNLSCIKGSGIKFQFVDALSKIKDKMKRNPCIFDTGNAQSKYYITSVKTTIELQFPYKSLTWEALDNITYGNDGGVSIVPHGEDNSRKCDQTRCRYSNTCSRPLPDKFQSYDKNSGCHPAPSSNISNTPYFTKVPTKIATVINNNTGPKNISGKVIKDYTIVRATFPISHCASKDPLARAPKATPVILLFTPKEEDTNGEQLFYWVNYVAKSRKDGPAAWDCPSDGNKHYPCPSPGGDLWTKSTTGPTKFFSKGIPVVAIIDWDKIDKNLLDEFFKWSIIGKDFCCQPGETQNKHGCMRAKYHNTDGPSDSCKTYVTKQCKNDKSDYCACVNPSSLNGAEKVLYDANPTNGLLQCLNPTCGFKPNTTAGCTSVCSNITNITGGTGTVVLNNVKQKITCDDQSIKLTVVPTPTPPPPSVVPTPTPSSVKPTPTPSSVTPSSVTPSSVTPIVIPDPTNKKKKWIIIGGVILLILIIILFLVIMIL